MGVVNCTENLSSMEGIQNALQLSEGDRSLNNVL